MTLNRLLAKCWTLARYNNSKVLSTSSSGPGHDTGLYRPWPPSGCAPFIFIYHANLDVVGVFVYLFDGAVRGVFGGNPLPHVTGGVTLSTRESVKCTIIIRHNQRAANDKTPVSLLWSSDGDGAAFFRWCAACLESIEAWGAKGVVDVVGC